MPQYDTIILNCRDLHLDIIHCHLGKIKKFEKIFDQAPSEKIWLSKLTQFSKNFAKLHKQSKVFLIPPEILITNINTKISKNNIEKFTEIQSIHRQLTKLFHIHTNEFILKFKKISESIASLNYIVCLINKIQFFKISNIFKNINVTIIPPLFTHAFFAKSFFAQNNSTNDNILISTDNNITRLILVNNDLIGIRQFNTSEVKYAQNIHSQNQTNNINREITLTTNYFINKLNQNLILKNILICSNNKNITVDSSIFLNKNNAAVSTMLPLQNPIAPTSICNQISILGACDIITSHNNQTILFKLPQQQKQYRKILIAIAINISLIYYSLSICSENKQLKADLENLQKINSENEKISQHIQSNINSINYIKSLQNSKYSLINILNQLKLNLNKNFNNLSLDFISLKCETEKTGQFERNTFALQSCKDCTNGSVMLNVRGRLKSASSSVQTIKEHLNVCLMNLMNSTVKCMKVELKSKKNSSATKDFVFSLMSDPESYM